MTAQLLIPDWRGAPVYTNTKRWFSSFALTGSALRIIPAAVSSMAETPPYIAG